MSFYSVVSSKLLESPLVYGARQLLVDKRQTVAALVALSGGFAGKRVLELGCGPGTNVALFKEAASYTGVDNNPEYIRKAASAFPDRSFIVADATKYQPAEPPDLVLIDSFFHHIDDDGVKRILTQAATWLTPDARIVMQEPMVPERREAYHYLMMRLDRGHHFRRCDHYTDLAVRSGLAVAQTHFSSLRLGGFDSHHYVSLLLRAPAVRE